MSEEEENSNGDDKLSNEDCDHVKSNYISSLCSRLAIQSDSLEEEHLKSSMDAQMLLSSSTESLLTAEERTNKDAVPNILSPYTPTPSSKILSFFSASSLSSSDVMLDVGCGDGRVCVAAAHELGCKVSECQQVDGVCACETNATRFSRARCRLVV